MVENPEGPGEAFLRSRHKANPSVKTTVIRVQKFAFFFYFCPNLKKRA